MEEEDNQLSIPLLFRCPISLDLFTDPVTLPTGQTYDRPSIEKWLSAGKFTCPVTMQTLPDFSFVPNHTLRHHIHRWLLHNVTPHRLNSPQSSGISLPLTLLKACLLSPQSPLPKKLHALKKIRTLCSDSDVGTSFLTQLDFFPLLLHLAFLQSPSEPLSSELVELALDCILRLSPSKNLRHFTVLQQGSAFSSLLALLERGSLKVKSFLCLLIQTITISKELSALLGGSKPLLRAIVSLLLQRRIDEEAFESAAGALSGICKWSGRSQIGAIEEGAVEGLSEYLLTGVGRNAPEALAAMEVLMGEEVGRREGERVGAVRAIVKWVFRVSGREEGSERALGALMAICRCSSRGRYEAVAAGAVTQLLLLLQSQCGGVARARARELLKFLRESWEEDDGMR